MVEGHANVVVKGVTHSIHLTALECVRIWCQRLGFDVDAEPIGVGEGWKMTATCGTISVTKTGQSLQEVCTKMIEAIGK